MKHERKIQDENLKNGVKLYIQIRQAVSDYRCGSVDCKQCPFDLKHDRKMCGHVVLIDLLNKMRGE